MLVVTLRLIWIGCEVVYTFRQTVLWEPEWFILYDVKGSMELRIDVPKTKVAFLDKENGMNNCKLYPNSEQLEQVNCILVEY